MISDAELQHALDHTLSSLELGVFGNQQSGKVREMVSRGDQRIIVTTDRISAFDVVLGTIPHKGQVLNQLALWWFMQTQDIVQNHVLASPDPNVLIAQEAAPLPVEVVVRGYLTGVTKTSLWTLYERGIRDAYGVQLPNGLQKNDPLPHAIITPTTKAIQGGHDEQITPNQILERGLVAEHLWRQIEQVAQSLFARGQQLALERGLILVDTKYEFGTINGELVLIDEVHTPDSSRYWESSSYRQNQAAPHSVDKEYLRLWYAQQGYTGDGTPPAMTADFRVQVAKRYITAYERITGLEFVPAELPAAPRIGKAINLFLAR